MSDKKKKKQYDPAMLDQMLEAKKMGLGVVHKNGSPVNQAAAPKGHAYAPDAPGGDLTFAHTEAGNPYSMYVGNPKVIPADRGTAPAVTVTLDPDTYDRTKGVRNLGDAAPVDVNLDPGTYDRTQVRDLGDAAPLDLASMEKKKLSPEERDLLMRLVLGPEAYKRRFGGS